MNINELEKLTLKWSNDRGIIENGNISTQTLKLVSEIGELCDNIAKNNFEKAKDDIGDSLVVLTNIAKMIGSDLSECWLVAYNDIKDRKGFLNKDGIFVKEDDKHYKKLKNENK